LSAKTEDQKIAEGLKKQADGSIIREVLGNLSKNEKLAESAGDLTVAALTAFGDALAGLAQTDTGALAVSIILADILVRIKVITPTAGALVISTVVAKEALDATGNILDAIFPDSVSVSPI
jgi:hypothetical protein